MHSRSSNSNAFPLGYTLAGISPAFRSNALAALDSQLNSIFQRIGKGESLGVLAIDIRDILTFLTDPAPHMRLGSEPGKLLVIGWEQKWKTDESVYTILFDSAMQEEPFRSALEGRQASLLWECICQMIRFVAEGTVEFLRVTRSRDVASAIADYLSTRGFEVSSIMNELDESQMSVPSFDDLCEMIPDFDAGSADWVSSKTLANWLGIRTERLAKARNMSRDKTEKCGRHNNYLFWRRPEGWHPKYFWPLIINHAGHLVKIFPGSKLESHNL